MATSGLLRGSGRAGLPHPASTLGGDAQERKGQGWQMRAGRAL
jgi:hypothetical protein